MNAVLKRLITISRLGLLPVRIRHGYLRGARWSAWPHSSYWRRCYEPEVQDALLRRAPPTGSSAWDLGAHFGFYSLWLARAVGPDGEVAAFEPDPVSYARLAYHVRLNPWARVRSFPCAASQAEGVVNLIQSGGAGATTSHLAYPGETDTGAASIRVRAVQLDAFAAEERLRAPSLVKVDVEGHAAAALAGAQETIRQHRPRLLISLHSPEECAGVRDLLDPLGYAPRTLDGEPLGWDGALYRTAWFSVS